MKKIIINISITLVVGLVLFYFWLPPINVTSSDFWSYITFLVIIFVFITLFTSSSNFKEELIKANKTGKLPKGVGFTKYLVILVGLFILPIVINFVLSPLFFSNEYYKRISVSEEVSFSEGVEPVNFNSLPLLDKASSQILGDRVMGQLPELVSQFYVSTQYTQINLNEEILRVTPLEYDGLIRYFTNREEGVAGYITVDSITGESELTKLEEGMKFMDSAYFGEDLNRHIRFNYPTEVFSDKYFELDNEGNPYWVVPTLEYKGIGIREEVSGVILVDPISGDMKKYDIEDVPEWVDHAYPSQLVLNQINDWGKYENGFLNSIFGQRDVVTSTEGYNYLVMNNDVYLYTGITSVAQDESNLGFVLVNLRTKETNFYASPGAEEYSAMASAEGQVQNLKYTSTFPILINLNNRPTYLMSLKDNANLVKMYAFVDVEDYQKVVVTDVNDGIVKAAENYLDTNIGLDTTEIIYEEIQVSSITFAIIDGNTNYYIVGTNGKKYVADIMINEFFLPFVKVGQYINVGYRQGNVNSNDVYELLEVK